MITVYPVRNFLLRYWVGIFLLFVAGIMSVISSFAARQASVVVEWSTASELDTAGFNIYRGESPDQIILKVNPTLIPPALDPLRGDTYRFNDHSVTPGIKYFYLVEEVDQLGNPSLYGPIDVVAAGGGKIEWVVVVVIGLGGIFFLLKAFTNDRSRVGGR